MNLALLCDNRTFMQARCIRLEHPCGREVMTVVARMTYAVAPSGAVSIALDPDAIRLGSVPLGSHPESSLRYPSDCAPEKPGTDVLLLGTAQPPAGATVSARDVTLRVAHRRRPIEKTLTVHGPRVYYRALTGVIPGPAAALGPTPLVYELAYGGEDEPRNPAGIGAARDAGALVGLRAPQIEDPRAPIASRSPAPAGFGPIGHSWEPRRSRMGTMDEPWRRERAPIVPTDFDLRHYCCAPDDQWSPEPLVGDELVEVVGVTAEGALRFRLPRYEPRFTALVAGVEQAGATHLDTLLIDADRERVELTWRASFAMPRPAGLLERIAVRADEDLPRAMRDELRRALAEQGAA